MRGRHFTATNVAVATALAVFVFPRTAHAYLDPGTGSALVYVVSALVASTYFFLRGLYLRILELAFRGRFRAEKRDIILHSEVAHYESTFLPIIRALAKRKIPFAYVTMYERPASAEPLPPEASHRAIPSGLVGYSYLNHLEAKLVVTTTPQLDVMMFRRSKNVRHYSMVQHGLGEARFDRPFAFDYFDSIMCCGPLIAENIRKLEALRKLPPKKLLPTGVPHYSELLAHKQKAEPHEGKTVLIAPSWGPMGLFSVLGTDFVKSLVQRYRVIVRPHPQMKISEPALLDEVRAVAGITLDAAPTPAESIARADIVVSDISGIVYEFAFIHEKPVVVIDGERGLDALEGHLIETDTSLQKRCAGFVFPLAPADIADLPDKIEEALGEDLSGRIAETRASLIHNFGTAGDVAAAQIEELVACL